MMGKRFFLAAALATLLASAGCKSICEKHGYYPVAPAPAYAPQCCVPCVPCQPAPAAPVAYAPPAAAPSWNTPAVAAPAGGTCCCPAPPAHY